MSTRGFIIIDDDNGDGLYPQAIYKHSDCYISGTYPFLKEFTDEFFQARGFDPMYFLAQYLRHSAIDDSETEYWKKYYTKGKQRRSSSFLGWGVTASNQMHGDLEYIYHVTREGEIRVYRTDRAKFWDDPRLENTVEMTQEQIQNDLDAA